MTTPRPYYNQTPTLPVGTVGEIVNDYGRFPAKLTHVSLNGLWIYAKSLVGPFDLNGYHQDEGVFWHSYFEPFAVDCTCNGVNNPNACDACRAYAAAKYGDNIPFGGE